MSKPFTINDLPSYDAKGNIIMHDVLMAKPSDFFPLLTKKYIVKELSDLRMELVKTKYDKEASYFDSFVKCKYSDVLSNYIHAKLDSFNENHRTPNFKHSVEFCFWYCIYGWLISGSRYPHHSNEYTHQKIDLGQIDEWLKEMER